jgi:hypothetical protein
MIKLTDLLNEAKQVGPLYHFTEFNGLKGILSSNTLKVGDDSTFDSGGNVGNVSLTRDKNMWISDYRIELDGNKLSDNYKITPYAFDYDRGEAEEYINRDIKNIKNYITGITVYSDKVNEKIKQIQDLYPNLKFFTRYRK